MRGLTLMILIGLAVTGITPPTGVAHAKSASGVDAPFWTGNPDVATFEGAHVAGLERARANLERMRAVKGKRTFDNTLRPYDDAMRELDLVASQASLIENCHPDEAMRTTAEGLSQKASALATEISLDRSVYDALNALEVSKADPATRHYVEKTLRDFRLSGVDKDEATRDKVKKLREELVEIGQEFSRNIRAGGRTVELEDAAELEGLPEDYLARHQPGENGKIVLTTEYPDALPVFNYAAREDLRKRMYHAFANRAHPENMEVLDRLIAKRHELATLLGFSNWAEYVTADKMVGSGKNAARFIEEIVDASTAKSEREFQTLLAEQRKTDPGATTIQYWNNSYLQEQVRKAEYDFDSQKVRPYFPYERVEQGVLDVTARLFGVEFRRVTDAPVWDPSVRCFEMFEDGKLVGRFYLDSHPRDGKFTHAAQFDIRTGVKGLQLPEAALLCNFPGGDEGDPGLMSHSDVRTFFHEFGHLMHTLFSGRNEWLGTSGIRTEWDFVEAPSQMLEEWIWDPGVLATFAKHHETGEPIPAELVRQMKRASEFGKGLGVRRQMALAQISLSCYNRPPSEVDTDALVREISERYTPYPFVEDTHMQCAFGHLDGYSAIYYTYMWSSVIAKDMFSAFDRDNMFDPAVAAKYRAAVLAPGGSKPATKLVESFLGRPFNNKAWRAWLNEGDGKTSMAQ